MSNPSIGQVVADAWDGVMETSPDPFRNSWMFDMWAGKRRSYRFYLDEQPRNYRGDLIPRIATVRINLRRLGSVRLPASRLPA